MTNESLFANIPPRKRAIDDATRQEVDTRVAANVALDKDQFHADQAIRSARLDKEARTRHRQKVAVGAVAATAALAGLGAIEGWGIDNSPTTVHQKHIQEQHDQTDHQPRMSVTLPDGSQAHLQDGRPDQSTVPPVPSSPQQ